MKKWLSCCNFLRSEIRRLEKVNGETNHTDNASSSASPSLEISLVDNPKDMKRKLDMVKKEFERTEKFRIQSCPVLREKVIGMDSIPIYKETAGKLVSIGTSKTIVYTDN